MESIKETNQSKSSAPFTHPFQGNDSCFVHAFFPLPCACEGKVDGGPCACEHVSILYTAPTAIRSLMAKGDEPVKKYSRSSLRVLGTVGEPINPEAWRWYYEVSPAMHCPALHCPALPCTALPCTARCLNAGHVSRICAASKAVGVTGFFTL